MIISKTKFLILVVLDLYRPASGSVVLIDVNPFGETTDSLLFDWDELRSKVHAPLPPVFRVNLVVFILERLKIKNCVL